MSGFTKLQASIINSSIWDESDAVRIVWITMLAMSDASGFVESSLPGLAHQSRKSKDETIIALHVLESPDTESKNPDYEGRRIKKVEGGWLVLNYALYREQAEISDDPKTVATRERVRRHRERKNAERYKALHSVTSVTPASASEFAFASEKGDARGKPKSPPIPAPLDTPAFRSAWEDWQAHRREIKKPLTATSIKSQLAQFEEWGEQRAIAAIRFTIRKGWQGLREDDSRNVAAPARREKIDVPITRFPRS